MIEHLFQGHAARAFDQDPVTGSAVLGGQPGRLLWGIGLRRGQAASLGRVAGVLGPRTDGDQLEKAAAGSDLAKLGVKLIFRRAKL